MKLIDRIKSWFAPKEAADPQSISELLSIVKNLVFLLFVIKDANADKKISISEWMGIGKSAFPLVQNARNYKLIKAQILDFSTDEAKELIQYVITLGILPEKATLIIEKIIVIIEKSVVIYKEDITPIIEAFKK